MKHITIKPVNSLEISESFGPKYIIQGLYCYFSPFWIFLLNFVFIIEAEKKELMLTDVLVAGSVGPYGACLHDGSEYTGSYSKRVTKEQLMDWHRPRMKALLEAGADLLALETIPCTIEAEALVTLLKEFPHAKAWLSFSICDPERISNRDDICEAASLCWRQSNQLIAIGANCFHPSLVKPLFMNLKDKHPEIPVVVYPNTGESYNAAIGRWNDTGKVDFLDYVQEWLNLGIQYIGGCCRTNDKVIRKFKEEIEKWHGRKNDGI